MTELLTTAQMRSLEQSAIDSGLATGLELMERAGRGVIEAIFEEWPELATSACRAVVLCGPGNNGGDGFVVARLLKEWGWEVDVFLYGDPKQLPPDAATNFEKWSNIGSVHVLGFPMLSSQDVETIKEAAYGVSGTCLVVDALFGTGLARPLTGLKPVLEVVHRNRTLPDRMPVRTVSIDLPSGLCSDSGKRLTEQDDDGQPWSAIQCDLTVSFHRMKVGHVLADGPEWSGKTVSKSIGLDKRGRPSEEHAQGIARLIGVPNAENLRKTASTHKFSHGHALVLTGGPGKTGAARLAARGALRVGAGLVTLGVPPAAQQEVACHITALMLHRIADGDALNDVLTDNRIRALCMGPGMGTGDESTSRIAAGLKSARPIVLDADALTVIGRDHALFARLHEHCVLTPHVGEFKRLFPDIADKLNAAASVGPTYSKVDATRDAAKQAGCVVLFKGSDTVIAAPDGRVAINAACYDRAAPWLATAGSGDVLAGFITGLLARGFTPMQAAETGAWLHVECARAFGPGLIAEDLPDMLPQVFKDLGL